MEKTETDVAREMLVAVTKEGARLFRNQVGMAWFGKLLQRSATGTVILTAARQLKVGMGEGSSDYVGWTPVKITTEMVGSTVAVFTAIETKRSRGGIKAENQINFIEQVRKAGGRAGFALCAEDGVKIVRG